MFKNLFSHDQFFAFNKINPILTLFLVCSIYTFPIDASVKIIVKAITLYLVIQDIHVQSYVMVKQLVLMHILMVKIQQI